MVNFIGDPDKRIKEDYLRILRYIRFFLNYSKQPHNKETEKTIKKNISGIKNLSKERLINELEKIIISKGVKKLNKDNFCKEIILIIFPQLKNLLSTFFPKISFKKLILFLFSLEKLNLYKK